MKTNSTGATRFLMLVNAAFNSGRSAMCQNVVNTSSIRFLNSARGSSILDRNASSLLEFHGGQAASIRLVTEIESITVPSIAAVPLGMIATEAMTNSFKASNMTSR